MSTEKIEPKQLLENLPIIKKTAKGIYMILSILTGQAYIGHTKSEYGGFNYRFRMHIGNMRRGTKSNPNLRDLVNKYGEQNLILIPLEEIDVNLPTSIFKEREKFYIDRIKEEFLLNEEDPVIKKVSEKSRQRISTALKGKYTGENHWLTGTTHTEERKQQMSERFKGKNNPQYGHILSAENKRKMAEGIQKKKAERQKLKESLPTPPSKTGKRLDPGRVQFLKERVVTEEMKERNSWSHIYSNIRRDLEKEGFSASDIMVEQEFERRKNVVIQARQMKREGKTYVEISEYFNQNIKSVIQFVTGKTWKYLPGAVEE